MARGGGRAEAEHGALRKGPWTPAEDSILKEYVRKNGDRNWNSVQRSTGLTRCGKSCRLRWSNHLQPNLKKCAFSRDEEIMILSFHAMYGNKWARIAAHMPGRTDNEIKNYWNTRVKRHQRAGLPLYPPGILNAVAMAPLEPSPSPSPANSAAGHFSDLGSQADPQLLDDTAYMPLLCHNPQAQFSHDPAFFQQYDCSQLPLQPQHEQLLTGPLAPENYQDALLLPAACSTEVVLDPPPSRGAGMFTSLLQDASAGEFLHNDDMLLLRMVGHEELGGQAEPITRWNDPSAPIVCESAYTRKEQLMDDLNPVLDSSTTMHRIQSGGQIQSDGPTPTAMVTSTSTQGGGVESWLQQMDSLSALSAVGPKGGLRWNTGPIHWCDMPPQSPPL